LFGIGVDIEEIFPHKYLTARVKKPKASSFRNFINDAAVFLIGEFFAACLLVANREVVVAVNTTQWTPPGHLNRSTDRDPLSRYPALKI
jgi:hypothetical protein